MIEVYRKFFDFYFDLFSYEKIHGTKKPEKDILRELLEFQKDVVFWGSDQVLRAFLNFKESMMGFSRSSPSSNKEDLPRQLAGSMKAAAALLVAMRRDIGYSFTTFDAKDLARLQLADDDETRKIFDYLQSKK